MWRSSVRWNPLRQQRITDVADAITVVPIGWPPRSPFLSWSSRGSDFATAAEKMAVIMTRLLGAELERTRGRRRSALVSLLTQLPERVEHYYQWVRSFVEILPQARPCTARS